LYRKRRRITRAIPRAISGSMPIKPQIVDRGSVHSPPSHRCAQIFASAGLMPPLRSGSLGSFSLLATVSNDCTIDALDAEPPPQIVVWPESAATFFLDEEHRYRARIAGTLTDGTQLLIGTPRSATKGLRKPPYFNSVYVLTHEGRLAARYDKQLLVPFAEYFPFGGIELLRRRFARVREFARGSANAALPTTAGPAGVLVCNEAMLPEVASQRVEAGATWLVSPSNDSWVPNSEFAELQFDIVRLRAVEQRRFVVRASTSGPSAIVDPHGRVLARTDPRTRATVQAEIQPQESRSVYSVVGDSFGLGCIAVSAVAAFRRRRSAV
jgi:apolipoprotein N-acyltransferase